MRSDMMNVNTELRRKQSWPILNLSMLIVTTFVWNQTFLLWTWH